MMLSLAQDSQGVIPSARFAERMARWFFAGAMCSLVFVFWSQYLEIAAGWSAKELRVLPRMSIFIVAALIAIVIQGGRPRPTFLWIAALIGISLQIVLIPWINITHSVVISMESAETLQLKEGGVVILQKGSRELFGVGVFLDWLRFELSLMSAICAGLWLGNGLKTSGELIALLFCAIVGDVWLNYFHIPETVDSYHVLKLLRLPWPAQTGQLSLNPAWTDIVFFAAMIASVHRLRLHLFSVVMGAVAGYCGASFLALEPIPAWPTLSMGMCVCGVLIASLIEMKIPLKEIRRALFLAGLLGLFLVGMYWVQQRQTPPQLTPPENWSRRKYMT
jgi:hypothetical protein